MMHNLMMMALIKHNRVAGAFKVLRKCDKKIYKQQLGVALGRIWGVCHLFWDLNFFQIVQF
jgi:hypothetical protein